MPHGVAGLASIWRLVPVEAFRLVTDRWEWASLSQLVASVYHEPSWTEASVSRLRSQFLGPVKFGYVRLWLGNDVLVGCPVIGLGDEWFNTPRARPEVISGTRLANSVAVSRALKRVENRLDFVFYDDQPQLDEIDTVGAALETRTARTRKYRAVTNDDLRTIGRALTCSGDCREAWLAGLQASMHAGSWATEVVQHFDADDAVVGWTVWAVRQGALGHIRECLAVTAIDEITPAWTSVR